ncbi:MAG: caspase family protein [Methylococcaceae bacterium]|nr:caspase family protein [Methylococcaceae bacterium]
MKSINKRACFDDQSFTPIKLGYVFMVAILTALIGCQSSSISDLNSTKAAEGYSPQDTDKLFIVDCLLPGQIRKLGSQMTYLSARRPVKTTAGDCEIRGGEYVAYDRANYASALKVWLPQAQQGDAEAQVTLGEIYEKGLGGGVADPKLAAQWYLKAAEQGNSRAKVNLGYLYEKGLGVKQDKAVALNWYRKASGLESSDLQFASAGEVTVSSDYQQQLEKLRQESKGYKEEAESLRKQLDTTQQQLSLQKQKLLTIENQLDNTRSKLNQEQGKSIRNEKLIHSLQKDLETNQSNLDTQQQQVSQLETKLKNEKNQILAKQETDVTQNALKAKQPSLEPERHQVSKPKRKSTTKPEPIIAKAKSETISKEERNREQQKELAKNKLAEMNAQLQAMEANYQNTFLQIKVDMDKIDEKSGQAQTTQDQLFLEKLRVNLTRAKSDLSDQGKQIKELKNSISVAQSSLESLENQSTLQVTGPVIEITDPPITLTRGNPSYQLRSITKTKAIAGKVASSSGLKSLEINQQAIEVDKNGLFKSEVAIVEPLTVVKIVATDKQDNSSIVTFNLLTTIQETTQVTTEEPPEKTVSSAYPSINFGQFYALIIGNNDYANLPALKTSANDAKAIDEILRVHYGYKTTLLINASRHQIMTSLNNLRNTLTENDNLVIYYAGHGDIDKKDQSAYWLPTDAEANNSANWLSSHDITQYLNVISARHILVIADSCYSGAMTTSSIARIPDDMPESKREKWLNFMINRKARTVMTSGGVKPVLDSGSGNHSIFANALLKALKSNNGLMEDYKLYNAVASKVKQSASNVGFQQMPQYSAMQHAGHEGSPFFFVPKS